MRGKSYTVFPKTPEETKGYDQVRQALQDRDETDSCDSWTTAPLKSQCFAFFS